MCRLKHNSHQAWKDPEQKTTAVSSTQFNIINSVDHIEKINCGYVEQSPRTLPMFVSSCPGWICYVEKTYPQLIPFLSTTKSPQQILGILVKKLFRNKIIETITSSPSPSLSIIHNKQDHMKEKGVMLVSIQPCFDKKLEASRLVSIHSILVILYYRYRVITWCRISITKIFKHQKLILYYQQPNSGTF
jgi:iron only hydrogenase large subunit-like protein